MSEKGNFILRPASINRVVLTITADGRIEPGPGLSMDEATRSAARMLAEHYGREMERIRREEKP